jgi:hypothetical protein
LTRFEAATTLKNDTNAIRALLEYHILNGIHPSANFGLEPIFAPTLLSNPNYTNVTGGQVVELAELSNVPTIVSGVKASSRIVEAVRLYYSNRPQAQC